jgi:hypothetical protein
VFIGLVNLGASKIIRKMRNLLNKYGAKNYKNDYWQINLVLIMVKKSAILLIVNKVHPGITI